MNETQFIGVLILTATAFFILGWCSKKCKRKPFVLVFKKLRREPLKKG